MNKNEISLLGTIIHEVQHAIQSVENFQTGTTSTLGKQRYYESLGEIEADDTRQRFVRGMTQADRYQKTPKSSLEKPKHSQFDAYMSSRGTIDKIKDKAYNYFKEKNTNAKVNKKNIPAHKNSNNVMVDGRGLLNNNSFSIEKNNEWKNYLEENYKSTGIKTDMNQIKLSTTKNKKNIHKDYSRIMNPNEISQLSKEDANTTPILPKIKRNNKHATEF